MVKEVKKCCTYRTVRTAVFNFTAIMSVQSKDDFQTPQIKPCEISKVVHHWKYRNHRSVICGMVKHIYEIVVFLPVRAALSPNGKPDRVLLWTGLRRRKSKQQTTSAKIMLVGDGNSPHRKPILRIYGGKKV